MLWARLIAAYCAAVLIFLPTAAHAEFVTLAVLWVAAEFALPYVATSVFLFAGQVAVAVGISVAVSAASSLLAKKAVGEQPVQHPAPTPQDVQQTIRQSTAVRRRHYGLVKTGGAMAFYQSKDGYLYGLIMEAQGEVASFEEFWLNDKAVTLDINGRVTDAQYQAGDKAVEQSLQEHMVERAFAALNNDFAQMAILDALIAAETAIVSRVRIKEQRGTDAQTAHAELITAFPDLWTTDHRLRGIANVLVILQDVPPESFSSVYPQGPPAFRAVLAAALVDDPRSGSPITHEWSDNPALCILDFLTHADGMGRLASMFDQDSFIAAADICDELILIAASGSPAQYEKRYRLSCSYDLAEAPADVLTRMLAACDGEIYQLADGTYGLRVGKWDAPTVTIEDGDVLSYQVEQGSDALSAFNRLKLIYVSPDHDYQETEAEAWEDAVNIAETNETRNEELRLLCVPSPSQARRLGKIAMARGNPRWKGTVRVKFGPGLIAMGERIITLQLSEMEIDETFQVQKFAMASDLTYVDLAVSSLAAEAYDWDPETEEGEPPPIPADAPATPAVGVPTGFVLDGSFISIGATMAPVLTAVWDTPVRDTIAHEINYRKTGTGALDWVSQTFEAGVTTWQSGVLEDGGEYEARLRARTVTGRASEWTATQSVTLIADDVAPDPPTSFSTSLVGADVTAEWTAPNSSNFAYSKVYRGTTAVFVDAAEIAIIYGAPSAEQSYLDAALGSGTYYWWVVAFNGSHIPSSEVGPETETVP